MNHYSCVKFVLCTGLLLLSACATTHRDFKMASVKPSEGVAIGKINVIYNGSAKNDCTVCFNSAGGTCTQLDQTGLVFKNLPQGQNQLHRLMCKDVSVQHFNFASAPFQVREGVTYFGDVTLRWNNKGGFKSTDLFGAIGAAISESKNDGEVQVEVSKAGLKSTREAFEAQTQTKTSNVSTSLIEVQP